MIELKVENTEMIIQVADEFLAICKEIKDKKLSLEQWRLIESCDMFQTSSFCGGFDGIEDAFCFSYYDKERKEFWFQVDFQEVEQIVAGSKTTLAIRPAS